MNIMDTPMFRWGILGTAQIARKNWKAIRNTGNDIVAAVASRSRERSQRFIAECQSDAPFATAPKALGSYEELIESEDIHGVYIPLPTGIRKEWVLRAARARKHVICEKPCAINVTDLAEMVAACREHGVQFMDGVMFMHSKRLEQAREVLDDGATIGRLRRISTVFNFNGPDEFFTSNIRVQSELEPLGCLGDLGWYCIRFALWAMHWELPQQVSGRILSKTEPQPNQASVPTEFSGELFFDNGVSSNFYCSFITELQQCADISGTLGYLRMKDFVLPYFGSEISFETQNPKLNLQGCDFDMESNTRRWTVKEYSNSHASAQETNLFRRFVEQVRSGNLNHEWPEMALKTQRVAQACLESANLQGRAVTLGNS
jgi:predicted dehydrogenase